MTFTRLDYLRHGEPVGGNRFRGNGVDDPLSARGWQQMRDTAATTGGWQRIISSPLQRCHAFAEWLGQARNLPVEVVGDLREVGFGAWEGCNREELERQRLAEYDAFYADPVQCRPTGAEPLDAFGARVAAVFDDLIGRYAGQHLLVVCHAGVIRGTLGHVTQAPLVNWYRTEVNHAAITRFLHDHRGARLLVHNWLPRL